MNTSAALATEMPAPPPPPAARKQPVIDPNSVTIDSAGQVTKSLFVRLPAGMIADDLKEHSIWRKVQLNHDKSARQFDRVTMIAFDQSWMADAIVSESSEGGLTLAGIRIVQTPQRARVLFRDDRYGIVWNGVGYHVERNTDGQKMTETVANERLAERDLRNLYPRPV